MKLSMYKFKSEELSEEIYNILYKNGKPQRELSVEDFMTLLFISDDLSDKPILSNAKNEGIKSDE